MRTWTYYGVRSGELPEGEAYYAFIYPSPNLVRMTGTREPIKELTLVETEDEESQYWGWITKGRDYPTLIHSPKAFNLQFPSGYVDEEERGRGVRVKLNVVAEKDYVPIKPIGE